MKKIIFATGNANKMVEVRMILADCGYEIVSMKEAGIDIDIVEDGKTFEENAIIKATAISKTKEAEGCVVLADDSGLEVDYMDGAPGIYSARWQGEDTPYSIKNQMIIDAPCRCERGRADSAVRMRNRGCISRWYGDNTSRRDRRNDRTSACRRKWIRL